MSLDVICDMMMPLTGRHVHFSRNIGNNAFIFKYVIYEKFERKFKAKRKRTKQ